MAADKEASSASGADTEKNPGKSSESAASAWGEGEAKEKEDSAQSGDAWEEDMQEKDMSLVQGGDMSTGSMLSATGANVRGEDTSSAEPAARSEDGADVVVLPVQGESVSVCGALSVDGTKLVDGDGNPVQLRGVSTHGLAWYPDYVNKECFRQLRQEWGMNVVRLAMYTAESGGYCTGGSQSELKALVKDGVAYATEFDMYVIIDWHILSDGNPNTYIEEAKSFFDEMSKTYAAYTNVIYEICNEPNGGVSWGDIKSYAEQVIEVIRNNDEDGIILVGTPNWSQYVDQAAADPIEGYDNIMYTLHFYAATHTDALRSAMVSAIEDGLPVFVSEYGICDASGSGAINEYQANLWVETLDKYQISYVAWNLSNKSETSAIIQSSCSKVSGFGEEDLSSSGKWLYGMLQEAGSAGKLAASDAGTAETSEKEAGSDAGGMEAPGKDADAGENPEEGAGLHIAADRVNSWEQDGESYYQYRVTITNDTGTERDEWTIRLVFSGNITLHDKWNGNYQADGNTLTIFSMDYNGYIAEGGSVGDIGFILHGADNLEICDMAVLPEG